MVRTGIPFILGTPTLLKPRCVFKPQTHTTVPTRHLDVIVVINVASAAVSAVVMFSPNSPAN